MPPEFWQTDQIRDALAGWHIGRVIAAYRHHPHHGPRPLPQELVAGWLGITQTQLSRIETGPAIRDLDKLTHWARTLRIPAHCLWFDLPGSPRHDDGGGRSTTRELATWSAAADERRPAPRQSGVGGDRSAPAPRFEPLGVVTARVRRLAAATVEVENLDVFDLAITDVVSRYEAEGPHGLAREVVGLRCQVDDLRHGTLPAEAYGRVLGLAGRLSGLLGYMAVNSGRFALAELYCAEAFDLAVLGSDPDLQAWIRGTQSLAAYYDGRFEDALQLARDGQRYARDGPQSIRLAVNGEARALGRLGDRHGVDAAVAFAFDRLSEMTVPAGMTPCISFGPYSEGRVVANAATAYLGLGVPALVMEYGERIGALVDASDSAWSQSLVRLDVATAQLRRRPPEVEQAMVIGIAALQASADHPIRSIWQRAHELNAAALRWKDVPMVRDFIEALHAWESRPSVRVVATLP